MFFPCCTIGWSQTDVYVLSVFLVVSLAGLVFLTMCCVFPCRAIGWSIVVVHLLFIFLLCYRLVSCCCLIAVYFLAVLLVGLMLLSICYVFPCCAIGWSCAAIYMLFIFLLCYLLVTCCVYMLCIFLLCHWLVSCCYLCAVYFLAVLLVGLLLLSISSVFFLAVLLVSLVLLSMTVYFLAGTFLSRAAVYVLCIFLAVSLVSLLLLFMCCVNSCCAIGLSHTVDYVLSIFLTVTLVSLVLLSMCCIFSLLCHWLVSCCCLCALCFPCCVIGWSRAAVYVLCDFLAVSLVGLVLLSMCFVFSLLCHWLVSCCCLCALCFPCCVIGWSRAAVYVLCVFLAVSLVGLVLLSMCFVFSLLCHWLVSCCCLCALFSLLCVWLVSCCCLYALCLPCCVIGWSRAAVYVLCVFLAVSLVGLVLLSMCFVFSWLCLWLVSCCCLCALCFPCCVIGWSRAAVYVLCVFLAVSLVGLVLLSMCFVFSLLCHWLVSCCCLCALCFPFCVIGWCRAAVYVLCAFLAVSLVGVVLLSMCFVFSLLCHWLVSCCCLCALFSLLCHWLVSCCCLCALCFPCCVIGWSRAAVYVICVFLAVSLVGLVLLSMCFVFSLLCHWLVSCCCLCALCFPCCVFG